jgi:AraC family transcriptional regulator
MVQSRLRYLIDGQVQRSPDFTCLMSSAEGLWSDLLIEHQKMPISSPSAPFTVIKPHLLVVTSGQTNVSWRAGGSHHVQHWRPGTSALLNSDYQLRDVTYDAPCEQLMIEIDESKYALDDGPRLMASLVPHMVMEDAHIDAITKCIREEIIGGCQTGKLYAQSLSLALLSYISNRFAASPLSVGRAQRGLPSYRLKRVFDYIQANLSKDVSLHELAAVVGLSPRHFAHYFKQAQVNLRISTSCI